MIAKANGNLSYPQKSSTTNCVYDYIRIGFLWLVFGKVLYGMFGWWFNPAKKGVTLWYSLLITALMLLLAAIFATQLQIKRYPLKRPLWTYLGFKWTVASQKMITKSTLRYMCIGALLLCHTTILRAFFLLEKERKALLDIITTSFWSLRWLLLRTKLQEEVLWEAPMAIPNPWWAKWILTSTVCLIAPIAEEMLFRGVIINELRYRKFTMQSTLVISSLLFTLAHGYLDILYNISIFVLGIILGKQRYQTQSLYVPIMIHIAKNVFALLAIIALSPIAKNIYSQDILEKGHLFPTLKHYYSL